MTTARGRSRSAASRGGTASVGVGPAVASRRPGQVAVRELGHVEPGPGHHRRDVAGQVAAASERGAAAGSRRRCQAATPASGASPCSRKWSDPPGRSTRRTSASAWATSGIVQRREGRQHGVVRRVVGVEPLAVQTGPLDRDRRRVPGAAREPPADVGGLDGVDRGRPRPGSSGCSGRCRSRSRAPARAARRRPRRAARRSPRPRSSASVSRGTTPGRATRPCPVQAYRA